MRGAVLPACRINGALLNSLEWADHRVQTGSGQRTNHSSMLLRTHAIVVPVLIVVFGLQFGGSESLGRGGALAPALKSVHKTYTVDVESRQYEVRLGRSSPMVDMRLLVELESACGMQGHAGLHSRIPENAHA